MKIHIRKFVFFILIIITVIVIGALLPRHKITVTTTVSTNDLSTQSQPQIPKPTAGGSQIDTNLIAGNTNDEHILALSAHDFYAQTRIDSKLQWGMPINFWGRVVDENNNSVAGATANLVWTDLSPNGTSEANATSDANGIFSLFNQRGKRLLVSVGKEGYYSSSDARNASFEYAQPDVRFVPDSNKPVIFHLRRKCEAETLIVMRGMMNVPGVGKQFQLTSNGVPVEVDLLQGRMVSSGGQIEIQYSADRSGGRPYDWECEISVPGGGIILSTNEFDFKSPSEGYQPTFTIEMSKNSEHWTGQVTQKYLMRFADGKFGRMNFVIYADKVPFCTIESFINPSGSPNLEDDPNKEVKAGQ
jgi:hypothetical protein